MTIKYPIGYGTELVYLDELIAREIDNKPVEAETRRRLIAFVEHHGGDVGIGDGWRPTPSPTSPASAAGKSFHQTQRFADGFEGFCAWDLVQRNGDQRHKAPEVGVIPPQGTTAARTWGLHANVGTPGRSGFEPWHIQPIEIDGYDRWVAQGRPRPRTGYPIPTPLPPPTEEDTAMFRYIVTPPPDATLALIDHTGDEVGPLLPWFVVEGGAVRYATGFDVEIANVADVPRHQPTGVQYDLLVVEVFGPSGRVVPL